MIPKQTEYKVGMYLRLSNEDERAGESLSIENQRKILTNYISEQGWTLYDEYVDDGISGTTFDRPGVQRMLDDAKNGSNKTQKEGKRLFTFFHISPQRAGTHIPSVTPLFRC
ncbi:MAG: recombinase family protein [Prevotella sp.]